MCFLLHNKCTRLYRNEQNQILENTKHSLFVSTEATMQKATKIMGVGVYIRIQHNPLASMCQRQNKPQQCQTEHVDIYMHSLHCTRKQLPVFIIINHSLYAYLI